MTYASRTAIDVASRGSIKRKIAQEAHELLEELTKSNYQAPLDRLVGRKQVGVLELDQFTALQAQLTAISKKLSQ